MAKSWMLIFAMTILQLRTFKTQIMTYTRALVYHRLSDFVAERINHKASNIFTYREKSSNPVRSSLYWKSLQGRLHWKSPHHRKVSTPKKSLHTIEKSLHCRKVFKLKTRKNLKPWRPLKTKRAFLKMR